MKIETLPPIESAQRLFIVNRFKNALAWGAWREWYHYELGKNFFPDTLTTLMAYPPQTQEGADRVAAWINEIRAKTDNTKGKGGIINPVSVPAHPAPWRRWSQQKEIEYLHELREEFSAPPQRSPEEVQALLRNARSRYPRAFGRHRPATPEETERLAYVETPPDLARERAERLAAKLGDHREMADLPK